MSEIEEERQQGVPSTSFLESLGSEALSQVSDLSNVSVRSRQLEDSIRHLAGQIETFEAQLEDHSPTEGAGVGCGEGGEGGEGRTGEEEYREVEALQQRLIKKKEAMDLLRARKVSRGKGGGMLKIESLSQVYPVRGRSGYICATCLL